MANSTSVPYGANITFIESPVFFKLVYDYLSEEEYSVLQWTLAVRPKQGKIISGSGGLRKVRWSAKGRGKGARIIYYWQQADGEIWMLTIYAKNEAENIPAHILKKIKEVMEQ